MNLPKTFKQTSEEPYDRHDYKLIFSDGNSLILDNYEDIGYIWTLTEKYNLRYVEVLDKKDKKSKAKGF
jgi:hypothetical protein